MGTPLIEVISSGFFFNISIQKIFVDMLRDSFKNNNDFRFYTPDTPAEVFTQTYAPTKLSIYSGRPKVLTEYPALIVGFPTIGNIPRSFGDDMIYEGAIELSVPTGYCKIGTNTDAPYTDINSCNSAGGVWSIRNETQTFNDVIIRSGICDDLSIPVQIFARTTSERELLANYVISYIRRSNKKYLEQRNVDFKSINKRTGGNEVHGSELIYTATVETKLFAEWVQVETADGQYINNIDYTINLIGQNNTIEDTIQGGVSGSEEGSEEGSIEGSIE